MNPKRIFVVGPSVPRNIFISNISKVFCSYREIKNEITRIDYEIKCRKYNLEIIGVSSVDEIIKADYVILLETKQDQLIDKIDIDYKFCIQEFDNYLDTAVIPMTIRQLGLVE